MNNTVSKTKKSVHGLKGCLDTEEEKINDCEDMSIEIFREKYRGKNIEKARKDYETYENLGKV